MDRNYSLAPLSKEFGFDLGTPVDRYYIENFLELNKKYIYGSVLEVGDAEYTKRYGTNVKKSEVLNLIDSPAATIVGNLETGENIPVGVFDCIILTQVLHVIYDIRSALSNTYNALKPGGTLLLTTTGLSQSCESSFHGDYWRFTNLSLNKLLKEVIPSTHILSVKNYGNLALAKALLDGCPKEQLPPTLFNYVDPNYQLVLTALAKK
ncbi:methyltransferase domain-containing protein [Pseudalkalibacillus hwajinpoensis]|uniref:methyltransferase domain-containing protein n=1 Tax=Guptibacillus hwajinpoensis TaxID=208199 RepID=UPI00325B3B03